MESAGIKKPGGWNGEKWTESVEFARVNISSQIKLGTELISKKFCISKRYHIDIITISPIL